MPHKSIYQLVEDIMQEWIAERLLESIVGGLSQAKHVVDEKFPKLCKPYIQSRICRFGRLYIQLVAGFSQPPPETLGHQQACHVVWVHMHSTGASSC